MNPTVATFVDQVKRFAGSMLLTIIVTCGDSRDILEYMYKLKTQLIGIYRQNQSVI